jgi:hypothetical protein
MHENVSKEVLYSRSRNFSKLCDFLSFTIAGTKWWPFLQLAGANRPIALANANAILRRVELVCEIAGPFAFGLLLSKYDPKLCVKLAAGAMVVTLPVLVCLCLSKNVEFSVNQQLDGIWINPTGN